jgi:hypothetical protein
MSTKGKLRQTAGYGVVVILLVCFSCGSRDKRDDIMTKEQMVKALMEIYIGEQKIIRLGLQRDSADRQFELFKQIIFDRNIGVSDSVFRRSFDYYMDRPKDIEQIYTAVVDSLSLREQRIDSAPQKK